MNRAKAPKVVCPECDGVGEFRPTGDPQDDYWCNECGGDGEVDGEAE